MFIEAIDKRLILITLVPSKLIVEMGASIAEVIVAQTSFINIPATDVL